MRLLFFFFASDNKQKKKTTNTIHKLLIFKALLFTSLYILLFVVKF